MAVTGTLDEVKVVLDLTKGSQTIPKCNKAATDAQLFQLGQAVAGLNAEGLESITKVQETILEMEV